MALIVLLFLTGHTQAFSQKKTKIALASLPFVTIRLTDPDSLPAARPENLFRHFEVIDERPDTARIGVNNGFKSFVVGDKQLCFTRPAREEVATFLNSHFARPGAPYTALIVLRTLWLSDANYIREDLVKDQDKLLEKTQIRLKAEIYAVKENDYMPVYRFDSTHVSKKKSYHLWGNSLAGMLDDLADSASLLTARKAGKGRSLRLEEIRQFNQSRFLAPVTADTMYRQGVYASFEEFKANDPSLHDFEIKKEKGKMLLYLKEEGGATAYSHTAWGYSDGKNIFIMKDGSLSPVWKEGKAFYFYGEVDKENSTRGSQGGSTYIPVSPAAGPGAAIGGVGMGGLTDYAIFHRDKESRIFTVDMDSGDVY